MKKEIKKFIIRNIIMIGIGFLLLYTFCYIATFISEFSVYRDNVNYCPIVQLFIVAFMVTAIVIYIYKGRLIDYNKTPDKVIAQLIAQPASLYFKGALLGSTIPLAMLSVFMYRADLLIPVYFLFATCSSLAIGIILMLIRLFFETVYVNYKSKELEG